jgi:hypothetical protein
MRDTSSSEEVVALSHCSCYKPTRCRIKKPKYFNAWPEVGAWRSLVAR